ncbi:peptidoglycan -binding protein [Radicibacter daui]|uniref:peptidoglycan -binding protein n=1 Tax=Radicibacter daui TaxID=3064829 RepID=UPI0040470388
MRGGRFSGRQSSIDVWPGWVDALSSLVMVIIFVLLVFMIGQYYLSSALTGRDQQVDKLSRQVAELSDLLALEKDDNSNLRLNITSLSDQLQSALSTQDTLKATLGQMQTERDEARDSSSRQGLQLASLQADIKTLQEVRDKLEAQVAALSTQLEGAKADGAKLLSELGDLRDRSKKLEAELADQNEKTMLKQSEIDDKDQRIQVLSADLDQEKALSAESQAKVDQLSAQIAELNKQVAALNNALDAIDAENKAKNVQILDLQGRLNAALATKVQELQRYRSDFFGRLREVLGSRDDVRIVGDRFVFQSEVLFASGSADIGDPGKQQLAKFAQTLLSISKDIPDDLDWVLRIDGHTDDVPISTPQFPSNWELSSARAIAVLKFLVSQGVPAQRLAAAGFAEYQPLDAAGTPDARKRNRRIEMKLDQR